MNKRNRRVLVFSYNLYCGDSYGCSMHSTLDGLVMQQITKRDYIKFFGKSVIILHHGWYKPSISAKRTNWLKWCAYVNKRYLVVKSIGRGNKKLRKLRGR